MVTRKRWPLALKLSLVMTTLIAVVVVAITLLSLRREQNSFETELQQQPAINVAVHAQEALRRPDEMRHRHGGDRESSVEVQCEDRRQHAADAEARDSGDQPREH